MPSRVLFFFFAFDVPTYYNESAGYLKAVIKTPREEHVRAFLFQSHAKENERRVLIKMSKEASKA